MKLKIPFLETIRTVTGLVDYLLKTANGYNPTMRNPKLTRLLMGFLVVFALLALMLAVYYLPPVHERLAWRVSSLRAKVFYFLILPAR